jgi:hypothetical protein
MKFTFRGPTHRVQLIVHQPPVERRPRVQSAESPPPFFRVDALPHSAHPSTPYVRGMALYGGPDAQAAWVAVRRFAPRAEVPFRLREWIGPELEGTLDCPFCRTPIRPNHRRTRVTIKPEGGEPVQRWAHAPCASETVHIDPKLLPTRPDSP